MPLHGRRMLAGKTVNFKGVDYEVRVGNFKQSPMAMRVEILVAGAPRNQAKRITFNQGNWARFNMQMPKNCSYLDDISYPEVEEFLTTTGLAKPMKVEGNDVVRNVGSGWYTLYKFDEQKLRECHPGGYIKYERAYEEALDIESTRYGMAKQLTPCPDMCNAQFDAYQLEL